MLAHLRLDRNGPRGGPPLHEQLIGQLRELILRGDLPPGTRLPASRRAAGELGVSRNVVVLAYEQLRLEGYLASRVGRGTWVPDGLPGHMLRPDPPRIAADSPSAGGPAEPSLSAQGRRLSTIRRPPLLRRGPAGAFRPCVVAPEHFPARTWSRLAGRIWRSHAPDMVPYGPPEGDPALRAAVAAHVRRYRAVRCEPRQILITSGSQQALDLVARMLVDAGGAVGVEEPGYQGARLALAAAGGRLVPVPVDREGLRLPGAGGAARPELRLVYVTPSHQFPLGVTLSLARRLELLDWARESGGWIVEDDYDSEFRYESRPLPSLQGLDRDGRVIYVGTFSKILAAGLRLGFMVLPHGLVEPFRRARTVLDGHPSLPLQATMAEFIAGGHLERHVARLRSVYSERREALAEGLATHLGHRVEPTAGAAGLHLTVLLEPGVDDREVSRLAEGEGVEAPALSPYYLGDRTRSGLVLGFAPVPPEAVGEGVRALGRALDRAGAEVGVDGEGVAGPDAGVGATPEGEAGARG